MISLAIGLLWGLAQPAFASPLGGCKVLELSHPLDAQTPFYPTYADKAPFRLQRDQGGSHFFPMPCPLPYVCGG